MVDVHENFDFDLSHWISGTRFFGTDDGQFFVVDCDSTDYPDDPNFGFVRRPTTLLFCNADATVTDLIPDHVFPSGTSCEEAISEIGFNLVGET